MQTDFVKTLEDRRVISITVTGRRSGREVRLPVWFVREGEMLWLLPLHGSRTQWYRNVVADPAISLRAGRLVLTAKGRPRRAQGTVRRIVELFRKKYTARLVARYFDRMDVVVEVPTGSSDGQRGRRKRPVVGGRVVSKARPAAGK